MKRMNLKKWMIAVSCMTLVFASSIPTCAEASTSSAEVTAQELPVLQEMTSHVNDDDLLEIDLSNNAESAQTRANFTVTLNTTISANTRVSYVSHTMDGGDRVVVSAQCTDSSIVYRVGIRDQAGNITYVQGSGTINHSFTIPAYGKYAVIVENRSNKAMTVTGAATYIY